MKRKIAVILAAGVDRYKEQIGRDEAGTLRCLARARPLLENAVGRHEGRIFNTAGDALLAEFQSAVEAVRAACEFQRELRESEPAGSPGVAGPKLCYRIGITVGDVMQQGDGDLLGDGVNIAARLQGIASPGGICLSRSAYEHAAAKLPLRFVDIGFHALKNIPDPVHAYTVDLDGRAPVRPRVEPARAPRGRLVVPLLVLAAAVVVSVGLVMAVGGRTPVVPVSDAGDGGARTPAPVVVDTPSRAHRAARCTEILERAQLGKLSRDDRQALQRDCQ
jgi:adenylate cyclase